MLISNRSFTNPALRLKGRPFQTSWYSLEASISCNTGGIFLNGYGPRFLGSVNVCLFAMKLSNVRFTVVYGIAVRHDTVYTEFNGTEKSFSWPYRQSTITDCILKSIFLWYLYSTRGSFYTCFNSTRGRNLEIRLSSGCLFRRISQPSSFE